MQTPPPQASPIVQGSLSVQAPATAACAHPVAGTQESLVHTLLSLQSVAECVHVPWGVHTSTVQALLSLHELGPETPAPTEHTSGPVQAIPSSQDAVLFGCVQTPPAQMSVVHTLPSLHSASEAHTETTLRH